MCGFVRALDFPFDDLSDFPWPRLVAIGAKIENVPERIRTKVWLLISNSGHVDHLAILGAMFREENFEVLYAVAETGSGFPFDVMEALSVIKEYDSGVFEIRILSATSFVDVSTFDIIVPQTPYLDDHLPQWMVEKFAKGRWLCSPYGYAVRQKDEISSVMDERFSFYFAQDNNYFTAGQLDSLTRRGARVVSVGHPSMHWLRQNEVAISKSRVGGNQKPIVAMQFHWTKEFCSLNLSLDLLRTTAGWLFQNFGMPLIVESHSLLGLFDGYRAPSGYAVAEVGEARLEIQNLMRRGIVVESSYSFMSLVRDVDVIVADGQSTIAFAAAAGAAVSVPEIATARDLNPEIAALPNVHRHNPTNVSDSLELVKWLIEQIQSRQTRPSYFQALGLEGRKNPVQELLGRT